jgi:mannose-1-phosphate guanylyltransferase
MITNYNHVKNEHTYCLIMGGGVGSRFWPYSCPQLPKQFLDFFGTGRTLIQQTYDRYVQFIPKENILVATHIQYKDILHEQLPELEERQILYEPTRRNTAPCIARASYYIRSLDPEACIVVAPSDQLIVREERFREAVMSGFEFVCEEPRLLTLGIKPHRPETGYGYIQIDEDEEGPFHKVKAFIEKPAREFAETFVASNEFYWNSSIFIWQVDTIIQAFLKMMPELGNKPILSEEDFASCPNINIDYGIMERADNVYVEVCDFGWTDLGTWHSLYEVAPKDESGNVSLTQDALFYNSRDNIIALPQGKAAVVKDLEGYLIAMKDDTLVVCRRNDEASIRKFINDVQVKLGEKFV